MSFVPLKNMKVKFLYSNIVSQNMRKICQNITQCPACTCFKSKGYILYYPKKICKHHIMCFIRSVPITT